MRGDGIKHETTSTGTGTLTLTGVSGWPSYDDVFGTSGTRLVDYTILDNSGVPVEGGVGSIALSTMVLTRSQPLFTWNGTTYSKGIGVTALSLASGTKGVICAPATARVPALPPPFVDTGNSQNGYSFFTQGAPTTLSLTSGRIEYWLAEWPWHVPIDRVQLRFSTANTSGSGYYCGVGMWHIGTNGRPGAAVAIMDTWATQPHTVTTAQTSTAITDVMPEPGWYWFGILATWTGGSGTPAIRTNNSAARGCGIAGFDLSNGNTYANLAQTGQTALANPAGTPVYPGTPITSLPSLAFKNA